MFLKKQVVSLLGDVEVLRDLAVEDLERFAGACRKVSFGEGDLVLEEGDPPPGFYVVAEGELRVFLPRELKGRKEHRVSDVDLNRLREGDCFGEYSLLDRKPASASIRGARAGSAMHITTEDFLRILEEDDRIGKTVYRNLLRILVRRLRKREKEYDFILVRG
jgi:CRP-like cAMP-binding protein